MAKQSQCHWQAKALPTEKVIEQFKEETGASTPFATLCLQRGITDKAQLEQFLNPCLDQLHDPFLMHDMQKGIGRIRLAIERGERILVYGDYDADGITSTTILAEAIDTLGGDVHFYLPNRFTDGYGPNVDVFRYMIDVDKVELIVTCDNGVSGHEAIQLAMDKGVDVIVTDHHELPEILPNAYAIIHPRHPEGTYPFGDLSGAGVAFKVATALLEAIPMESLDIVAIGTVADLVSLTDENRVLVHYGLDMLKQTQRIGLIKLLESVGVEAADLNADTIGFGIGPRLNALGRLDDATPGVDLLMTFDEDEAEHLVAVLQQKNNERKSIVEGIVTDIQAQLTTNLPNCIVLANENWHAGVLGIVASRIVEQTGKPTILLQIDRAKGVAKGSGRSVESINLFELLAEHSSLLEQFGGHHMAAGMTVAIENIPLLTKVLHEAVPSDTQKTLTYDLVLNDKMATIQLAHEINRLAPFGTGNPRPVAFFDNVNLMQIRKIGTQQQHVKGTFGAVDFIQFNAQQTMAFMQEGTTASLVGQLAINEWNGLERVQCQVMDVRIDGVQFFDMRATTIKKSAVDVPNALYLFADPKYMEYFKDKIPSSSYAKYYQDVIAETVESVVLFDCPQTMDALQKALRHIHCDNVYVQVHTRSSAYLMGVPTREQFAKLYKIIYKIKQFAIKEKFQTLIDAMKLPKDTIIFMLQVFSDAKFVTISSGVLSVAETVERQALEETKSMKRHLTKIELEKALVYTDFAQLINRLKKYMNEDESNEY